MARYLIVLMVFLTGVPASGQNPVGAWSDHLSYYTARNIAIGPEEIFASTGSSIIVFNQEFEELKKISRVHGLSETRISCIAYSEDNKSLVIAYTSTNIDILKGERIYNIPDIRNKYIPGNKNIYRVKTSGRYAYLATSFGIVVLDIVRNEIFDTWKPGNGNSLGEVYDIDFSGNFIYAATNIGLYKGDMSGMGLSYYGNWNLVTSLPDPSGLYNAVVTLQNRIYVNRSDINAAGDSVYMLDGGSSLFEYQPGTRNLSMDKHTGGFTITTKNSAKVFNENGTLLKNITSSDFPNPDFLQSAVKGTDIWIADKSSGLLRGENMSSFTKLNLPGPYTNNANYVTNSHGRTFITGGALDNAWNNQWRNLQIFIHDNNSWHSELSSDLWDPMRVLPDPDDPGHYWVSTWGSGLLEYENNVLVNHYNDSNSPLQTIIPGRPYSRICGLAMDRDRNIWITQTEVPGIIKVLKADRQTWITFPITLETPTIGDIIITRTGQKWVILPRGFGLFVLDDNKTPENFTDDRYKTMLVKDNDNKIISIIYSIAEDLDGNIWVGTDQGPVIYYNPASVFSGEMKAFRVKVPRDDGTGLADYMLGTEIITSIAVDGANRKWLGTFSSGAYLLSSDGSKKLVNYTAENSPLLSNSVTSLAIDDSSGEIWIGTDEGVISVRGDATLGADRFGKVYTFPNPVRETYTGNVTITGLMRNTEIRITDISGNLVYRTISDGGQATWDLMNYDGQRVSTGVYLVFCATEDGSNSAVTKMLVIK